MKFSCVRIEDSLLFTIPIRTVSESNVSEHWTKKSARHKKQKLTIKTLISLFQACFSLPCNITLKRFAPRKLDKHDNLPMSFKWILDAICEVITGIKVAGRADDSDDIHVTYDQEVSKEYYITIKISIK